MATVSLLVALLLGFLLGFLVGRQRPRRAVLWQSDYEDAHQVKVIHVPPSKQQDSDPLGHPQSEGAADYEFRQHLANGQLIAAIKRYRELTGLGLKEAKEAVEALRRSLDMEGAG